MAACDCSNIWHSGRGSILTCRLRDGSGLQLHQQTIAIDTTPLRIRGTVGTSVYLSARAAGAPIEAIQQYLEALDQHLSLDTAIEPGDTFDIIMSYRRAASGESQVGELLYAGLERAGQAQAQLLRWGKDGQFFDHPSIRRSPIPSTITSSPAASPISSGAARPMTS